ncbi:MULTISPECIES: PadR family transcriptional regulator [Fischerella]|nr:MULTISPECIES: PadR family transcriptional regulator [Fischerella]MBD2429893.1 PadR family transcriptional regulator [Fischerella sp. FACHB-380]
MSLAYAIMGLLQQEQRTGYELKTNCFDQYLVHLWPADQAQIYRTLDKLLEQGWITCSIEIQCDRPNRKVYSVTEAGKAEFIQWLQSPHPLPTLREPLLLQLFFAAHLPSEAIVQLLEQQLAARIEKLTECENINLPMLSDQSTSREQIMQKLVLELVLRREQIYIDWLKTVIEIMHHQ